MVGSKGGNLRKSGQGYGCAAGTGEPLRARAKHSRHSMDSTCQGSAPQPYPKNPAAGAETLMHTAIAPHQYVWLPSRHGNLEPHREHLAVTLRSLSSVGPLVHPREGRGRMGDRLQER